MNASEHWKILLDRSIPAEKKLDNLRDFLTLYKVGTLEPRPSNNEPPIRIGMCGNVGSGKSSLVKSILTTCGDSQSEHVAIGNESMVDSPISHTHTVDHYTIAPKNGDQSPFQIVDTIGFPTNSSHRVPPTYKIGYLRDMLDGRWPDGKGRIYIAKDFWAWMMKYMPGAPKAKFRYDIILYVVTASSNVELKGEMDFLRRARGEIGSKVIPVLNMRGNDSVSFREDWESEERWPAVQCKLPSEHWEHDAVWIADIITVMTRAILGAEKGRYNS
jgi:hypothetical protein